MRPPVPKGPQPRDPCPTLPLVPARPWVRRMEQVRIPAGAACPRSSQASPTPSGRVSGRGGGLEALAGLRAASAAAPWGPAADAVTAAPRTSMLMLCLPAHEGSPPNVGSPGLSDDGNQQPPVETVADLPSRSHQRGEVVSPTASNRVLTVESRVMGRTSRTAAGPDGGTMASRPWRRPHERCARSHERERALGQPRSDPERASTKRLARGSPALPRDQPPRVFCAVQELYRGVELSRFPL